VARQPIFTKKKKLFAYELLFRTGLDNSFPDMDGDIATSRLLSSAFFSYGIDKISGGKLSFINFTEPLLIQGTPAMFPQEKIVVEILENICPSEEIVSACKELKEKGYRLALDDFEYSDDFLPLLPHIDLIKIDFQSTSVQRIKTIIEELKSFPCKLLAEKIETHAEFDQALALGFTYFQGYFFARPEVIKNKDISPGELTVMHLITQVHQMDFDVEALENLINQDVAVSYKLLKYLNSAYFSRLSPLRSIRQAVAFLGERGVRLFVSLIATSQLAENKPEELVRLSIIRARFLEQLGSRLGLDSGEMFMLGLFSFIDAILDNSMEYLVNQLPLSSDVCNALIHRTGILAPYLNLLESFERGEWQHFSVIQADLDIGDETISQIYSDALEMADSY